MEVQGVDRVEGQVGNSVVVMVVAEMAVVVKRLEQDTRKLALSKFER